MSGFSTRFMMFMISKKNKIYNMSGTDPGGRPDGHPLDFCASV